MTTEVKTTVPGNIWKVLVKVGDVVKKMMICLLWK